MNYNLSVLEFQIASEVKIDSDGKATFSIRAVARLIGISHTTLIRAFQPGANSERKLAKFLVEQGTEPGAFSEFAETGIPDITASLIVGYYAMLAGERCTDQAKKVSLVLNAIGLRAYAQKITNWEKDPVSDYKQALFEILEAQLPAKALPHQVRFVPRFWAALEKVYGLKRNQRACANFIKWRIYRHFPSEVIDRLELINPLQENGMRLNKIHQHFTEHFLLLLQDRITQVTLLLEFSDTKQEFRRKIRKIKPIKFNQGNVNFLTGGS